MEAFCGRPSKRLADEHSTPSKRADTHEPEPSASAPKTPLTAVPSAIEIRAFGLEDRAEAVISRGKAGWTLANLSKWRHNSLDGVNGAATHQSASPNGSISSKEYLRQRQRAYRQQCLANSTKVETQREQHK